MTKEEDYRRSAAETVELANHAADSGEKGRRLAMAEKWLDLADRERRHRAHREVRPARVHPLVEKKLPLRPDDE